MPIPEGWIRVSRLKLCPICERPDWCLIKIDGTESCCKRVISTRQMGEAGSIHELQGSNRIPERLLARIKKSRQARPDLEMWKLAKSYHETMMEKDLLGTISEELGLSKSSLISLRVGWSKTWDSWSFPMRDAGRKICGIRLRRKDGSKFCVVGSRNGLFIGMDESPVNGTLFICEGPTDTAALIDLGCSVVGRPDCSSGTNLLVHYVQRNRSDVVIIHDRDEPGSAAETNVKRGASTLTNKILGRVKSVRVLSPPASKDVRDWLKSGATHKTVQAVIDQIPYEQESQMSEIF